MYTIPSVYEYIEYVLTYIKKIGFVDNGFLLKQ